MREVIIRSCPFSTSLRLILHSPQSKDIAVNVQKLSYVTHIIWQLHLWPRIKHTPLSANDPAQLAFLFSSIQPKTNHQQKEKKR